MCYWNTNWWMHMDSAKYTCSRICLHFMLLLVVSVNQIFEVWLGSDVEFFITYLLAVICSLDMNTILYYILIGINYISLCHITHSILCVCVSLYVFNCNKNNRNKRKEKALGFSSFFSFLFLSSFFFQPIFSMFNFYINRNTITTIRAENIRSELTNLD